jgi:hypothetical protein
MPSGSRPGERRGGRRKGIPNRTTTEQMEIARLSASEATASGRKLGKDVLEELMVRFSELAHKFQPASSTLAVRDWAKSAAEPMFHKYASLAVTAAKDLAKYQSPTFKAVEISAPAPTVEGNNGKKITKFTLHIFDEDLRTKAVEHHPKRS